METGQSTSAEPPTATPAPMVHNPRRDARSVVALSMVSIATLVAAYVLGHPWLGLGVLAGANLLAWLVVIQGRARTG